MLDNMYQPATKKIKTQNGNNNGKENIGIRPVNKAKSILACTNHSIPQLKMPAANV